jgi:hypothetical protein
MFGARHKFACLLLNVYVDAWHNVMTADPLADSDEENPDEHVRLDYSRRLGVLSRLRGRSPTPEIAVIPSNSRMSRNGNRSLTGRWQELESWE